MCTHNAGRSQMAAALLAREGGGAVRVTSAGSEPASQVNPAVAAAMAEIGVDISREVPKPLAAGQAEALPYRSGSDGQAGNRVGPPPAGPAGGDGQSCRDGGCLRGAQVVLGAFPDGGGRAEPCPEPVLCPSEKRHYRQRDRGQGDPGGGCPGVVAICQVPGRLGSDERSQEPEGDRHAPLGAALGCI